MKSMVYLTLLTLFSLSSTSMAFSQKKKSDKPAPKQQAKSPQQKFLKNKKEKEHWTDITGPMFSLYERKKEIVINPQAATKLFVQNFPHLQDDWKKNVPGKIESSANARSIPDEIKKTWIISKDEKLYAKVTMFSKEELIVLVVQHKGNYLAHHVYECKAKFRILRNKLIDKIFDIQSLEKKYGEIYKGLRHGDSVEKVIKALGKPDGRITYQLMKFFKFCYFKDDAIITFDHGSIKTIKTGISQRLKDEFRKNNNHITRY